MKSGSSPRRRPSPSEQSLRLRTPSRRHVPGERGRATALDDEIVPAGFVEDRAVEGGHEGLVALRRPQHGLEVDRVLLSETGIEDSRRGDAYAVALLTEVMGHRGDEADLAARLPDVDVMGGAAGAHRHVVEGPALLQLGPQLAERQILVDAIRADLAQRHGLDQRQRHAARVRKADELVDLGLNALQRHHVELDGKPRDASGFDAIQNQVQRAAAGDRRETGGIERVQGDVDASDAGADEFLGVGREPSAVGGQREFTQRPVPQANRKAPKNV